MYYQARKYRKKLSNVERLKDYGIFFAVAVVAAADNKV